MSASWGKSWFKAWGNAWGRLFVTKPPHKCHLRDETHHRSTLRSAAAGAIYFSTLARYTCAIAVVAPAIFHGNSATNTLSLTTTAASLSGKDAALISLHATETAPGISHKDAAQGATVSASAQGSAADGAAFTLTLGDS